MNGVRFTESVVAQAALAWLEALGDVLSGPEIARGNRRPTGDDYGQVIVERRRRRVPDAERIVGRCL